MRVEQRIDVDLAKARHPQPLRRGVEKELQAIAAEFEGAERPLAFGPGQERIENGGGRSGRSDDRLRGNSFRHQLVEAPFGLDLFRAEVVPRAGDVDGPIAAVFAEPGL